MSKFSDFIRNATPEEKERVYSQVLKETAEAMEKQVRHFYPLHVDADGASYSSFIRKRAKKMTACNRTGSVDEKERTILQVLNELEEEMKRCMQVPSHLIGSGHTCMHDQYQAPTVMGSGHTCMHDQYQAPTVMGLACNCPKCALRC